MFGLEKLFGATPSNPYAVLTLPTLVVDYSHDYIELARQVFPGGFYGGQDVGIVVFPPSSCKGIVSYEAKLFPLKRVFSFDRVVEAIHAMDVDSSTMWEPAAVEPLLVFLNKHWMDTICERKMYPVIGLGTTSAHIDDPLVPVLTVDVSYNTGFPKKGGTAWSRRDYTSTFDTYFLAVRPLAKPTLL